MFKNRCQSFFGEGEGGTQKKKMTEKKKKNIKEGMKKD